MPIYKGAIFALLVAIIATFFLRGELNEGLDGFGWLILLVLFEAESLIQERIRAAGMLRLVHGIRLAALVAIIAAAIGYFYENDWLDFINASLWIVVVILLEIETRLPQRVAQNYRAFRGVSMGLYSALAILVFIWAWRMEWLDALDALLWLLAFATIEMDILKHSQRGAASA